MWCISGGFTLISSALGVFVSEVNQTIELQRLQLALLPPRTVPLLRRGTSSQYIQTLRALAGSTRLHTHRPSAMVLPTAAHLILNLLCRQLVDLVIPFCIGVAFPSPLVLAGPRARVPVLAVTAAEHLAALRTLACVVPIGFTACADLQICMGSTDARACHATA